MQRVAAWMKGSHVFHMFHINIYDHVSQLYIFHLSICPHISFINGLFSKCSTKSWIDIDLLGCVCSKITSVCSVLPNVMESCMFVREYHEKITPAFFLFFPATAIIDYSHSYDKS